MKITLQVHVDNNDGSRAMLHKAVELPFVPMTGMGIESLAWKGARQVKAVTVNVDDAKNDVQAYLGHDEEGSVLMYEEHGWTVLQGV